jgi:hypothetical protein
MTLDETVRRSAAARLAASILPSLSTSTRGYRIVLSTASRNARPDCTAISGPPVGKADANSDTPTTTLILIPRVFQPAMITGEMDDSYFYQQ